MDKAAIIKKFIEEIHAAKAELEQAYREHKEEAMSAPSAMQSASDMSRYQANTMAEQLRTEIESLEKSMGSLLGVVSHPASGKEYSHGKIYLLEHAGKKKGYLIVPEGTGGKNIKYSNIDIYSVSPNSPA